MIHLIDRISKKEKYMTVVITGKQIDLGDSLRNTIEAEIEGVVSRHLDGKIDASITVTKDAQHHYKTDIQLHVNRNLDIHCVGKDNDIHKSVSAAIEKLETQLRRYKTRLHEKRRHKDTHEDTAERVQKYVIQKQIDDTADENPLIIAESISEIHTLSVGDAVMKMDLSQNPVMLFKNAANGQLNVVFMRPDGNIGWIDPSLKLA
jgi:ribosomal subunit interface protein